MSMWNMTLMMRTPMQGDMVASRKEIAADRKEFKVARWVQLKEMEERTAAEVRRAAADERRAAAEEQGAAVEEMRVAAKEEAKRLEQDQRIVFIYWIH
jgi:hypothetical protein